MGRVGGSTDPVAPRNGGSHRSHRFIGANTFIAQHFGDDEQLRQTEAFLRGEGVPDEIRELVPDGPAVTVDIETPASVVAGTVAEVSVVLFNRGVGHAFPAGPNEVNDTWVEVVVRDTAGRVLLHDGALSADGSRGSAAFALISIPVDENGDDIFATAGLSAGFRLRRAILHGASDRESYRFDVPTGSAGGHLEVEARLLYRKSDEPFSRLVDGFDITDVPVTEIARAQVRLPVRAAGSLVDRAGPRTRVLDPSTGGIALANSRN